MTVLRQCCNTLTSGRHAPNCPVTAAEPGRVYRRTCCASLVGSPHSPTCPSPGEWRAYRASPSQSDHARAQESGPYEAGPFLQTGNMTSAGWRVHRDGSTVAVCVPYGARCTKAEAERIAVALNALADFERVIARNCDDPNLAAACDFAQKSTGNPGAVILHLLNILDGNAPNLREGEARTAGIAGREGAASVEQSIIDRFQRATCGYGMSVGFIDKALEVLRESGVELIEAGALAKLADVDEWKSRALAAEAQLREVNAVANRLADQLVPVVDELETRTMRENVSGRALAKVVSTVAYTVRRLVKRSDASARWGNLLSVVAKCADRFREYERLHQAKVDASTGVAPSFGAATKAYRNRAMAELCENALRLAEGQSEIGLPDLPIGVGEWVIHGPSGDLRLRVTEVVIGREGVQVTAAPPQGEGRIKGPMSQFTRCDPPEDRYAWSTEPPALVDVSRMLAGLHRVAQQVMAAEVEAACRRKPWVKPEVNKTAEAPNERIDLLMEARTGEEPLPVDQHVPYRAEGFNVLTKGGLMVAACGQGAIGSLAARKVGNMAHAIADALNAVAVSAEDKSIGRLKVDIEPSIALNVAGGQVPLNTLVAMVTAQVKRELDRTLRRRAL